MSSILTNNGAMVALQTLKSINTSLADTQKEISTGKSVANAKDNAAVWAISKVMESDVKGFQGISDSLNLGSSTVSVARQAAETVTDLLTDIKGKVVASQEENVDRAKIQTDIEALRDQIGAVVGAAQFNGLNLLSNTDSVSGTESVDILASLDRSSGGVTASDITVAKNDLGTAAAVDGTAGSAGAATVTAALAGGATATFIDFGVATDAATYGDTWNVEMLNGVAIAAGDQLSYVARNGDTLADVATNVAMNLNYLAAEQGLNATFTATTSAGGNAIIQMTNNNEVGGATMANAATDVDYTTGGTAGGGLNLLADFDVTTEEGAAAALAGIEGLIQKSIDSASAFGSAQGRIETQTDFVTGLTDALKSGIGTLVDADMEEASARLQALQVQQQLGVQALSIANQAPQQLLSLFR